MRPLLAICGCCWLTGASVHAGEFVKKALGYDEEGQPIYQYVYRAGKTRFDRAPSWPYYRWGYGYGYGTTRASVGRRIAPRLSRPQPSRVTTGKYRSSRSSTLRSQPSRVKAMGKYRSSTLRSQPSRVKTMGKYRSSRSSTSRRGR